MKKDFRPYGLAIVLFLIIILTMESCGSACSRQHRYWNTHRCV